MTCKIDTAEDQLRVKLRQHGGCRHVANADVRMELRVDAWCFTAQ